MSLIKRPTGPLSLPPSGGPLSLPPPSNPVPQIPSSGLQTAGEVIGTIIGGIIDIAKDSKQKESKSLPASKNPKALPAPSTSKDKNTPSFAGDPGAMNSVPSLDNSGYYYTPAYSYTSEPWGPGLVDTFRGSGLMDPFFL